MKFARFILLFLLFIFFNTINAQIPSPISLNGQWMVNNLKSNIPHISETAHLFDTDSVTYKKTIVWPKGDYKNVALILNGARFNPTFFVDDIKQTTIEGGMAPTYFYFNRSKNANSELKLKLAPLNKISTKNASYIPPADHWRSNVSSSIWDKVELHFFNDCFIENAYVSPTKSFDSLILGYELSGAVPNNISIEFIIQDNGNMIDQFTFQTSEGKKVKLKADLRKYIRWSAENPKLYNLKVILRNKKKIYSERLFKVGIKNQWVENKRFYVNGEQTYLRGASVVWHRFVRNAQGRDVAYNQQWMSDNIYKRIKNTGGNLIRYHLGTPPEYLLNLADSLGLYVQYEWLFFHGLPASKTSMQAQYKRWIELASRHPSVTILHPYNETEAHELDSAWSVLNQLLPLYPNYITEDRDALHIHKYWWSLFEEVGLYYDSYKQFPKAIMVDEFGGNYLDGDTNLGGYKTLHESFARFLGKKHTGTERLELHTYANAKIAEYWRNVGATGVAPFCALGSWEDGNHWFIGPIKNGTPKPVWDALKPAFAPIALSIDLWDRNFFTNQHTNFKINAFNSTQSDTVVGGKFEIVDGEKTIFSTTLAISCKANSNNSVIVPINIPDKKGIYQLKAIYTDKKGSSISEWKIYVTEKPQVSDNLKKIKVHFIGKGSEINLWAKNAGLMLAKNLTDADLIICDKPFGFNYADSCNYLAELNKAIVLGKKILLTSVGPRNMGDGFLTDSVSILKYLQGSPRTNKPKSVSYNLYGNVKINFTEVAEPESHIHNPDSSLLFSRLLPKQTQLWNGMRGGLIVPAIDFRILGINKKGLIAEWVKKGASENDLKSGKPLFAYHLEGFYAFSEKQNDPEVQKLLRQKVKFLFDDAPALKNVMNPEAKIDQYDLQKLLNESGNGLIEELKVLAVAGKNLTRMPVVKIKYSKVNASLTFSQLYFDGRIMATNEQNAFGFEPRYDPAAEQLLINLINEAIKQ